MSCMQQQPATISFFFVSSCIQVKDMFLTRFLLFLGALFLFSCGKKAVTTCISLPPDGILQVRMNSLPFKMPYWETVTGEDSSCRYLTTDGSGTSSQLAGIIDWLGLPWHQSPKSVVIYGDKVFTQGEELALSDVLGCQYYYVVGNRLLHSFYLMQQGRLVEVPAFQGKVSGISFNDRQDLYELYFLKDHKTVVAWDITDNNIPYSSGGRNEVSVVIQQMMEQ